MERIELHKQIDEQLNEMGFGKSINQKWGHIAIQVNFEKGEEVITIREHETKKKFVPKK